MRRQEGEVSNPVKRRVTFVLWQERRRERADVEDEGLHDLLVHQAQLITYMLPKPIDRSSHKTPTVLRVCNRAPAR